MPKTIQEKADELRRLGYRVDEQIGIRSLTGEAVLYVYVNGVDIDEQFIDQLWLGQISLRFSIVGTCTLIAELAENRVVTMGAKSTSCPDEFFVRRVSCFAAYSEAKT